MASAGISPIGAWSFELASVSLGEIPAFWKASFLCCFRAWEEGSLVESQLDSLCILVRKRLWGLVFLSWDEGVDVVAGNGLGVVVA